jgi:hypothetical protein
MHEGNRKFGGLNEGVVAPFSIFRGWRTFLHLSLPWLVLILVPVAALRLAGYVDGVAKSALLAALALIFFLALVVSFPTIAVAWARWSSTGERPPGVLALPDRVVPVVVWRLWIFIGAGVLLERWFASGLHSLLVMAHLPTATFADKVTSAVADIIIVVVASNRTLQLTALAVGDTNTAEVQMIDWRQQMWPGLPLGLVIALAPFYVLRQSLSALFDFENLATGHQLYDPVILGIAGLGIFLGFAGVASGAAFLSQAYQASKPQVG